MEYTKEDYENAQSQNILYYLINTGHEFSNEGGRYYRSKLHSSLVIQENGKWHWNSRDLHGNRPVELLKQLLVYDQNYDEKSAYISAVKMLCGTSNIFNPVLNSYQPPKNHLKIDDKANLDLELPEKNIDNKRVIAYLCKTRKLDFTIVQSLIKNGKLYETKDNHNACFVSTDRNGEPKHLFLRGTSTYKDFKRDISLTGKSYGFLIEGNPNTERVLLFESTIDALSHYTLCKMHNINFSGHRLSLNGLSFQALDTFLNDNPQINKLVSCLDNDTAGLKNTEKLKLNYSDKGFEVKTQLPRLKDFNLDLQKVCEIRENRVIPDLDLEP